jgi:serine/threonine protein kinase
MTDLIGDSYVLKQRIGSGSFGDVHIGENIKSHCQVAIKLEDIEARVPQLAHESHVYGCLAGGTGIPRLHWSGSTATHKVIVMDLLGESLEEHLAKLHRFSLKTVIMLADQMLSCLEYMHSKNFIHRDVKPDNFLMGSGNSTTQVFMIDYGLSRRYRDPNTHAHIPLVEGRPLTGTARYASLAVAQGLEPSRRDDLESLGFVMLYLLRGSLPWMGFQALDAQAQFAQARDMKARLTIEQLCADLPEPFVRYFAIVRALEFAARPNYAELRQMFRHLFRGMGFIYDRVYDWNLPVPPIPRIDAGLCNSCREKPPVAPHQNRLRRLTLDESTRNRDSKRPTPADERKLRIRLSADFGTGRLPRGRFPRETRSRYGSKF